MKSREDGPYEEEAGRRRSEQGEAERVKTGQRWQAEGGKSVTGVVLAVAGGGL